MPFPRPIPHPPHNPYVPFYALTGMTFLAFVTGFSVCLFDLSQISACVDYAENAVGILRKLGQHIIDWFIAVTREILNRYPLGR